MLKNPGKQAKQLTLLLTILLLATLPQTVDARVKVNPRKITFELGSDGSYSDEFEIVNNTGAEIAFSLRLSDWDMGPDGRVSLKPVGSTDRSLGRWISGYPDRVTVPPKESRAISFAVDSPGGEDKGRWGAFLVRPLGQENEVKEGLNVGIKVQYAVTLYGKPVNQKKSGRITSFRLQQGENNLHARFSFHNTSGSFLRPEGKFVLTNPDGAVAIKKPVENFLVLPGHRRNNSLQLDKPPAGDYRATLVLDYGVPERVGAIRRLQVK